jgi:UDP-glucose 4-epimerase
MFSLNGSKVLVTGGAGHIGSHVVDAVLAEGASKVIVYDNFAEGKTGNMGPALRTGRVEALSRDIRDYEDLKPAMEGCDYVFHTASIMLLEARVRGRKALEVNVDGTYNVLQAAVETGVKKVILSSSGSVYGEPLYIPMDEKHPYNNETLYGATKVMSEQLCRVFHRQYHLSYAGLRYFNVYGPRQHIKGAYAQIVPRWYDMMTSGERITIFGDGTQTMDMTYVEDVARANVLAAKADITADFLNVGTGASTSVNEVFHYLKDLLNYKLQPVYVERDVNLVKRRQCSPELAESTIGFKYTISVSEGLRRYVAWRRQIAQEEELNVAASASAR